MLTLIHHPEIIGTALRHTPAWVWALLAALVAAGITQLRDRTAGLVRVTILPLAMTGLSLWGLAGAFGSSPILALLVLTWIAVSAIAFALIGRSNAPQGTRYDAGSSTFFLPGSWVPLVTILGIFLTRYIVNVDVAITPALARDGRYTLAVAALYGVFTGTFLGRAARLWRLAPQGRGVGLLLQREPW
jgi:hypothetical protein